MGSAAISKIQRLKWWQVALIAVGVSLLGGLSGLSSRKKEQKIYTQKLKQAPWAPPAWLFGPAWSFNNIFLLLALQRIITRQGMSHRRKLLIMQGFMWVIFFSFNYVYFRKQSTVLAAIWTATDAALSTAGILYAAADDKKTALGYLPITVWTCFATTLATYQALYNDDDYLGTKALL